jgi:hypothetical protein
MLLWLMLQVLLGVLVARGRHAAALLSVCCWLQPDAPVLHAYVQPCTMLYLS